MKTGSFFKLCEVLVLTLALSFFVGCKEREISADKREATSNVVESLPIAPGVREPHLTLRPPASPSSANDVYQYNVPEHYPVADNGHSRRYVSRSAPPDGAIRSSSGSFTTPLYSRSYGSRSNVWVGGSGGPISYYYRPHHLYHHYSGPIYMDGNKYISVGPPRVQYVNPRFKHYPGYPGSHTQRRRWPGHPRWRRYPGSHCNDGVHFRVNSRGIHVGVNTGDVKARVNYP